MTPILSGRDSSRLILKPRLNYFIMADTIVYSPDSLKFDISRKSFPTHASNSIVLFLFSSSHSPITLLTYSLAIYLISMGGEKHKIKSSPETTELNSSFPAFMY